MSNRNVLISEFLDKINVIIKYYYERLEVEIKDKEGQELVSIVDKEIEEEFKNFIKRNFREDNVFGEETGGELSFDSPIWIIDPIDGTHNFISGNPHYAVSIAYISDRESEAWIFAPHENFLFYSDGKGFYINGREKKRRSSVLKNPLIATGIPYIRTGDFKEKVIIDRILEWTPEIRIGSSAALDLAYTAAGFIDGYIERGLKVWDVAAGIVMCRAVGLNVLNWHGKEFSFRDDNIIVTNEDILPKLLKIASL